MNNDDISDEHLDKYRFDLSGEHLDTMTPAHRAAALAAREMAAWVYMASAVTRDVGIDKVVQVIPGKMIDGHWVAIGGALPALSYSWPCDVDAGDPGAVELRLTRDLWAEGWKVVDEWTHDSYGCMAAVDPLTVIL